MSYNFKDLNKWNYTESDDVLKAKQDKINAEKAVANYGTFQYVRQQDLDKAINAQLNRGKFSYDLNGDALYQQYKENYINQGKQAMMDTMGQAAAMTGGYGNSYAATVGNQTYQGYLQNLNNMIPQLQQMALDRYNAESNRLNENFSLLSADRESARNEHELGRSNIKDLLSYYTDAANNAAQLDLTNYNNMFTANNDAIKYKNDTGYKVWRDGIDDERYAEDTKYKKEQDAIANALAQGQFKIQQDAQTIAEKQAGVVRDKKGNIVSVAKPVSTNYTYTSISDVTDELKNRVAEAALKGYKMQGNQPAAVWQKKNAETVNKNVGILLDSLVDSGEMNPKLAEVLMRAYYIDEDTPIKNVKNTESLTNYMF